MTAHVNHDYPHAGDLRVVSPSGMPIEGVEISIYELEKYLAGDTTTSLGETVTDADGNWVDTIDLESGRSWAVHFQKLETAEPSYRELTT